MDPNLDHDASKEFVYPEIHNTGTWFKIIYLYLEHICSLDTLHLDAAGKSLRKKS